MSSSLESEEEEEEEEEESSSEDSDSESLAGLSPGGVQEVSPRQEALGSAISPFGVARSPRMAYRHTCLGVMPVLAAIWSLIHGPRALCWRWRGHGSRRARSDVRRIERGHACPPPPAGPAPSWPTTRCLPRRWVHWQQHHRRTHTNGAPATNAVCLQVAGTLAVPSSR